MQAQSTLRGDQIKVVMHTCRRQHRGKAQTARHAQMHQQNALVELKQQILAAPAHRAHTPARQVIRVAAQRPAQGFAKPHRLHGGVFYGMGKTAPGHFYFG